MYGKSAVKIEVTLKVALYTKEDIEKWIRLLEEKTHCTYSIRSTEKPSGKLVLFKQRLNCHHNTRSSEVYNPGAKNRTKNTNCPSSLNVTLKTINSKFRGKKENAPDPIMPCIIIFVINHNHNIMTADALRFKRVSDETREKLICLYKEGHSPATALECLKIDIQTNHDNYEQLLGKFWLLINKEIFILPTMSYHFVFVADRSVCPDYKYCYVLFMNEFQKCYGSINYDYTKDTFLSKKIQDYNKTMGEECIKMMINGSHYIIV